MHEFLESAWLKLERAGTHVDSLDKTFDHWLQQPPFTVTKDSDPQNGDQIWRVSSEPTLPEPQLQPLIGDILHNYRAALDHLAWALVKRNGATPGEKTAFPLSRSGDHFRRWGKTNLLGMSADAKSAIKRLQPCFSPDPSHVLWLSSLDYLSIVDNHRHFNMTVTASDGGKLLRPLAEGITIHEGSIVDGTVLCRIPQSEVGVEYTSVPGLAFAEGPPRNASVQSILFGIREITTQLLTDFDQHFFGDDESDETTDDQLDEAAAE